MINHTTLTTVKHSEKLYSCHTRLVTVRKSNVTHSRAGFQRSDRISPFLVHNECHFSHFTPQVRPQTTWKTETNVLRLKVRFQSLPMRRHGDSKKEKKTQTDNREVHSATNQSTEVRKAVKIKLFNQKESWGEEDSTRKKLQKSGTVCLSLAKQTKLSQSRGPELTREGSNSQIVSVSRSNLAY